MLRALRALRLGWLLAVGSMAVLFLVYQSGLRDLGHAMKAVGGFVGGLAALIWIAGYFKWRETARFPLKSYPASPRALVRKTVLFQPLCFLVFSGGFTIVLLRLWHAQLRSTSVSIDQLLTLAVGALGLGLLAATDLLVRATRATYFPPPQKQRLRARLRGLRRIRLPRPSWRSVLGAVVLIVIPPLALGAAATVPHLVASRVTPSTAASIDTSALPALPRSFASTAAWSQDIHNLAEVVAGAAGPVVLSSDGVVGLNPADGSTRWTYPRKHARFIRCHPSPDRRHLAVTLDATDGEEADEPGELHARAGGHDGAVLPGGVQGCVGLGEDDEVFVAVPFAVPAAGRDKKCGEEREEDESSSENEAQGEAGELFDDRFGHGGEFDDGDDGADGDDQEDGDDVDGDVDAALRSLAGAHAVVAAQLVIPQAVGPGRGIELQRLIGHTLTIALSISFSRLTKQLQAAQLETFSLVRI